MRCFVFAGLLVFVICISSCQNSLEPGIVYNGDEESSCDPACAANASCLDGACVCRDGYVGDPIVGCIVDDGTCDDVSCGLNAHCLDGECYCDDGYEGEPHTECVPTNDEGCGVRPVIELSEEFQHPEPLDKITLNGGCVSSCPEDSPTVCNYFWEWAPNGRPRYAEDAVLISRSPGPDYSDFSNPKSIMGKWTGEGFPKIYFPIGGRYGFMLKVRDAAGNVSGPTDSCPNCPEWATLWINVMPSKKIHIELVWARGNGVDLDLTFTRWRPNGTYGIPATFYDLVTPSETPVLTPCITGADCHGGAWDCGGNGYCINSCGNDDECKAINYGWYCNDRNECDIRSEGGTTPYIQCETDADCGGKGYCNPIDFIRSGLKTVCTKHMGRDINDTCWHLNRFPHWGEYNDIALECSDDTECNGWDLSTFTCESNECDFSCDNTMQCMEVDGRYVCGPDNVCLANDMEDDPSLDIDDCDGWGPENISLKTPDTGLYRIIARLYTFPYRAVSNESPNKPVKAYVTVYLNGEKHITVSQELFMFKEWWKVADIYWDAGRTVDYYPNERGEGRVYPVCAGWTSTRCNDSSDCKPEEPPEPPNGVDPNDPGYYYIYWDYQRYHEYYDNFSCETRNWGKFYSTCDAETGAPEDCNPRKSCQTDNDCTDEPSSQYCTTISGLYCKCENGVTQSHVLFDADPYANPFGNELNSSTLCPLDQSEPRSIWCDVPEDYYNDTDQCSQLYR